MVKPLLTPKNIFRLYQDARTYTDVLNQSFDEFQRISRNEPHPDLNPKFPRLAEGSTAAYLYQKPRTLIQQTPDGEVTTDNCIEWLDIFGNWCLENEIKPNADEDYPLFEKAQVCGQDALTFGFKVTTAPFYQHQNGKYAPDMSAAFWGDVAIPSGYKSINAMPYTFIEGWWPQEKVEEILGQPNLAAGGWDEEALKQVQDQKNSKGDRQQSPAEKKLGLPEDYVHVVVAHQAGVQAPIYTFSPESKSIVRTKPNPDPRGKKNIQVLYGMVDGTNPFGLSIVQMVGAWQNLMDNDAQAYQYNRAYNIDPAIIKHGSIGDGDLHPGAEFEALGDNDSIETIELDTEGLKNYPALYEWQRGVLMNLLNSPPSSGDPDAPLGKTPEGIAQAASDTNTDDLTFVQHIHDWFGEWCETALNIYFAEMKGAHTFKLDEKTAEQLRALKGDGFNPSMLDSDNVLTVDFDELQSPIFCFKVKGGSSKLQDEGQQLQALQQLQETISNSPELTALTGQLTLAKIYNKIVELSGVHDNEDLMIDIKKMEETQAQQAAQAAQSNQSEQITKPPSESLSFKDVAAVSPLAGAEMLRQASLPPDELLAKVQPTENPAITNAQNNLRAKGVPDAAIPHAIEALTDHIPLEDILNDVQQSQGVPVAA